MIVNALYEHILLRSVAKFYGLQNRIRKKEILIRFLYPHSQFVALRFENQYHDRYKTIMNVLYANRHLQSFAKFYERVNQIKKKENLIHFLSFLFAVCTLVTILLLCYVVALHP